jgi:transglutaminase-like putative cysteine protease
MAGVPAAAAAMAWMQLEQDPNRISFAVVLLAGLVQAPPRTWTVRLAAALIGTLVVVGTAFSWPRADPAWVQEIASAIRRGLQDADVVQSPFVAVLRPELDAVLLVAVFAFSGALALAAAARRPLLCSALAVVAVGWPVVTLGGGRPIVGGAAVLAVALWPPLVGSVRGSRAVVAGVSAGLVVIAVASGLAAAGAKPSEAAVSWRDWDVFGPPSSASSVTLVWDSDYSGIQFPARRTTVLRIRAPRVAHYWRASTLDLFTADRWIENLYPVIRGAPGGPLPDDPLLPQSATRPTDLIKQEVEVVALVDDRLVGASQPTRIESDDVEQLFFLSGGLMRAGLGGLTSGQRYTVWSHAPTPSPAELVAVKPAYPAALARYLQLDRTTVPVFGAAGRAAEVGALFTDDQHPALRPYRGVWEQAARITHGAGTPYEATVQVERWLRDTSFQYVEQPPPPAGLPPLADFVLRTKQGYCQQFAGSMALMLRLLGIPSRVAVGFTSGRWQDGVWTVTDREAHAWVEVWFAGYGWLPFDPTPGRGTLSAAYTFASDSADAVAALGTGRFLTTPVFDPTPTSPAATTPSTGTGGGRGGWLWVVALGVLALGTAVGVAKAAKRRWRYSTRDPRRLAVAARAEIVAFAGDQGVEIRAGAGMLELRRAIEAQLGVPAGAFAESFSRARYGPPDPASVTAVRRDARRLVDVMRERLGTGRRLKGYFSMRSLR